MAPPADELYLSEGLTGQDENLDTLSALFEEIQLSTSETASADIDLLSFAHGAHFFGVICIKGLEPEPTVCHNCFF